MARTRCASRGSAREQAGYMALFFHNEQPACSSLTGCAVCIRPAGRCSRIMNRVLCSAGVSMTLLLFEPIIGPPFQWSGTTRKTRPFARPGQSEPGARPGSDTRHPHAWVYLYGPYGTKPHSVSHACGSRGVCCARARPCVSYPVR